MTRIHSQITPQDPYKKSSQKKGPLEGENFKISVPATSINLGNGLEHSAVEKRVVHLLKAIPRISKHFPEGRKLDISFVPETETKWPQMVVSSGELSELVAFDRYRPDNSIKELSLIRKFIGSLIPAKHSRAEKVRPLDHYLERLPEKNWVDTLISTNNASQNTQEPENEEYSNGWDLTNRADF
jgi:hypothetical protein